MIQPVPHDVVVRYAQEAYRKEHGAAPVVGATEAARLAATRVFIFRGRRYRVPPVRWQLALEVLEVSEQLSRTPDPVKKAPMFERAAELSRRVAQPVNPVRRLLRRVLPNDFLNGTPGQLKALLGFFCMCLVSDAADAEALLPVPGTSSQSSRRSFGAIPHGSAMTAFPSRGLTS